MARARQLEEAREALPVQQDAGDHDELTRALLRFVLRPSLASSSSVPVVPDPRLCPNCDAPCSGTRSPYCSVFCKEQSALIRQMRAALENGNILLVERQIGLGEALWHLQGGGFPRRQALVTPKSLVKIIERDGGLCFSCGKPAVNVAHIGSG